MNPWFAHAGRCLLLPALVVFSCAAQGDVTYDASVAADLSTLTVTARFPAHAPRTLSAEDDSAGVYLKDLSIDGSLVPLQRPVASRIEIPGTAAGYDVIYTVDIRAMAQASRFPRIGAAGTEAVLLAPGAWLWLPLPRGDGPITLRFHLPEGLSVSAPWPQVQGPDGTAEFQIGRTPEDWPALMAIGRFTVEPVHVPGAVLRFALLYGTPAPDRAAIRNWVQEGATAVAGLYGRFPLAAPQVLVVPVGKDEEPVPWGQVLRGGGAAAHLFIDQTRSPADFRGDWVLVHELCHMLHPNMHDDGTWLAEGIATYYQNVLRARAGLLSEQQAWQKLHEGFQRGIAETKNRVSLKDATREMMEKHLFMRVYWSGAAIVLLGDLALRRDGKSLDLILSRFRDCCLDDPRIWPAAEFMATLDRLAGTSVFMPLYRRFLDSDQFPDLSAAYDELGLDVEAGKVVLTDEPAAVTLRRALMGKAVN